MRVLQSKPVQCRRAPDGVRQARDHAIKRLAAPHLRQAGQQEVAAGGGRLRLLLLRELPAAGRAAGRAPSSGAGARKEAGCASRRTAVCAGIAC